MALSVIEFTDDSGDIMVARVPQQGTGEFKLGSQLVVQESQVAAFFRDGRRLDVFKAGRHTLTTANLPLLGGLISLPFGGTSPSRAFVCFVATKTFVNLGWGTPTPVMFRDAEFRMVSLRAHGSYSIRVRDPNVFLDTIVGTRGVETTFALEDFFRTVIVSRLNEEIASRMKSILDLAGTYGAIALGVKQAVRDDFGQYGVELVDLLVEAITVPPDVQKMLDRATGVAAQDTDKYRAIAAADALRDAAQNTGGAGVGVGAGLGLGAGVALGQELVGQMRASATAPTSGPVGAAPRLSAEEIDAKLHRLKKWKDDGLITDADFEEQKRRLLASL